MKKINEIGRAAKEASIYTASLSSEDKNGLLISLANKLEENIDEIIKINKQDVKIAEKNGVKAAFIDRLTLDENRVKGMADGLRQVAGLPDPIGEVVQMRTLPNGLQVGQKRVPMGVIGIIFEARPNVTADAFGLCLKAGSATILKGGSNALRTNMCLVDIFRNALESEGAPADIVQLITDTSHDTANEMMRLNKYIDVLIPRGSGRLINSVVENSTVPVIRTGEGNCHIYVDESADLDMAEDIVINAKVQRPGVCNAAETLLIHENIVEEFILRITNALQKNKVEVRGDETFQRVEGVVPVTEEDFATEFEDYIISAGVVGSLDEAMDHIRKYSTGHSECIVTENYTNAQRFLNEIDSACVYVNASTRFTDGNQFGFGAEIGISTQKLHARGPMGLKELTTTKYVIYGTGQIRK
ncbi:MAG: glutamate-5-semialdehyde dehydrogenase [Peptostreptococcaceae bacterium]|nr:glutamate-5-semialdehyde dehydrogenase [Peptostreptococcaceae bacterium]